MNLFEVASLAFLVALGITALAATRGDAMQRAVALQCASTMLALFLLTYAESLQRSLFFDLAVAIALLAFGSSLVFARFLERWT